MGPEATSDEDLLAALSRASADERRRLADQLFERHYARVARWCLRITGDRDQASDVAQIVFIKAYRHLGDFRGASKFSTWLYTIVRHECFAHLRQHALQGEGRVPMLIVGHVVQRP